MGGAGSTGYLANLKSLSMKIIKEKEASLEGRLGAKIKSMGGWSLKLLPTFVIGLPDRMCLLPGGRIFFAEINTTGEKPRRSQLSVHRKLEDMGFKVYVIDKIHDIDELVNQIHWDYRYNS